jgi:hypothetical protein
MCVCVCVFTCVRTCVRLKPALRPSAIVAFHVYMFIAVRTQTEARSAMEARGIQIAQLTAKCRDLEAHRDTLESEAAELRAIQKQLRVLESLSTAVLDADKQQQQTLEAHAAAETAGDGDHDRLASPAAWSPGRSSVESSPHSHGRTGSGSGKNGTADRLAEASARAGAAAVKRAEAALKAFDGQYDSPAALTASTSMIRRLATWLKYVKT